MATKTLLNSKTVKTVRRYAILLQASGIPYERLIVFGSQTKGTAKPWSDIDLCVVSSIFGHDRHTERVKLMLIRNDETLDIEPHPFGKQELMDKYDPLAAEIRRYGKSVS